MRILVILAGLGIFFVGLLITVLSLFSFGGHGAGKIDLTLIEKPTLMTAAYKVYGNQNAVGGKYWLGKLTLKNSGTGSLKDVKISYQIPNYMPWTTPETHPEILPGQTVVVPFYPRLPSTVTSITSMTPASMDVKIEYDDGTGAKSRTETRNFEFRGIHEIEYSSLPQSEILTYYDANDNSELNSAWVTEEDPIVGAFYSKVSEKAGGFGTMGSAKDIEQLAHSMYDFMVATGMTYSGTKGVPEKKGDDYVLVQSMRLPRDIINGNTGLCVELAQLWASIAIRSGAKCYLVMIPGHCFPVLQTNSFGDGTILPIEATGIGGGFEGGNLGAPMSYDDAKKVAADNFGKMQRGEIPGIMVDVLAYRDEGIRPPELPPVSTTDLANLAKMLDDRLAQHQGVAAGGGGVRNPAGGGADVGVGGGGGGGAAASVTWKDSKGRVSLVYPAGWATNPQLVVQMQQVMPGYSLSAANPLTQCGVDVIFFDGVTNPNEVAAGMVNLLRRMGFQVQTGQAVAGKLGGKQSLQMELLIGTPTGVVAGEINIAAVNGGMVVVDAGGPQQSIQAATPELRKVIDSVQIGN